MLNGSSSSSGNIKSPLPNTGFRLGELRLLYRSVVQVLTMELPPKFGDYIQTLAGQYNEVKVMLDCSDRMRDAENVPGGLYDT